MNKNIDFSKIVWATDLHLGMKNNSRDHNGSCENFIKWMIDEAKKENIHTMIFGGDWHHFRSAVNVSTLNYSVSCLKLISEAFDNTIFILGNHDEFYRDKREINSIPYISEFPNIQLIDKITTMGDFAFIPWLVGDEWKEVPKVTAPYMFGHFELPSFYMNAMTVMPDHGHLNRDHFKNQEFVFSGHFHKRQNVGKIWYTGNAFPHNYSDAWDDERGIMFWEPSKQPIYKAWPDAPKYKTVSMNQVLSNPSTYIDDKTFARITVDVDLSYEELTFIKEMFETELNAKEVHIQNMKTGDDIVFDGNIAIGLESVDHIVINHLKSIESTSIENQRLIEIYMGL
jgi:hypothetical protein